MANLSINLTTRQKQYLGAGVLVLGALGYCYLTFFWAPISQQIGEVKAKIADAEKKIQKATHQAARLPSLEAQLVTLNEQAVAAEKRLPKKKSVPDILVTVSEIASKYHVTLLSFTPGGQKSQQYFTELSYPITARGSFHSVGKFLAGLAIEERIFNVQNITYAEGGPDGAEIQVSFTLLSYQYKG